MTKLCSVNGGKTRSHTSPENHKIDQLSNINIVTLFSLNADIKSDSASLSLKGSWLITG